MPDDDAVPPGGLGDLFSQLQAAQADLETKAAALDAAVVEGSAAGGAVVVRLTGGLEAESVHVDPALIDPADPSLLEDALLAALRDALGGIVELRASVESQVALPFGQQMDLGGLVGGLDLGGLFGGVDVNALMGSLGIGADFGALVDPEAGFDDELPTDDTDDDGGPSHGDVVDDPEA